MIAPVFLAALIVAASLIGRRVLARAVWTTRAPALGIVAWQALSLEAALAVVLAGLALAMPQLHLTVDLARLLQADPPPGSDVTVVDHDAPLVYCLPGRDKRMVVTRGASRDSRTMRASAVLPPAPRAPAGVLSPVPQQPLPPLVRLLILAVASGLVVLPVLLAMLPAGVALVVDCFGAPILPPAELGARFPPPANGQGLLAAETRPPPKPSRFYYPVS